MAFALRWTAGGIVGSPETAAKELLSAPSVVVAGDHSMLHASASALKLVGRSTEEMEVLDTFEALFECAAAEPGASCMIGRPGAHAEAREAELRARAGQPTWCIAVHVPLPWCSGDLAGLALILLLRAGTLPPSRRNSWAAASMPSMLRQLAADVDAATRVGLLLEQGPHGWFASGTPSVGLGAASRGAEELGNPAALLTRPLCTWAARVAKAGLEQVVRLPWGGGQGDMTNGDKAGGSGGSGGGGDGGGDDCGAVVAFWPIPRSDETVGSGDAPSCRVLACAVPLTGLEPLLGDYVLDEVVGTGGLSTVVSCTHRTTGDRAAIKIAATAELSPLELTSVLHEATILAGIDHPHVVCLAAAYIRVIHPRAVFPPNHRIVPQLPSRRRSSHVTSMVTVASVLGGRAQSVSTSSSRRASRPPSSLQRRRPHPQPELVPSPSSRPTQMPSPAPRSPTPTPHRLQVRLHQVLRDSAHISLVLEIAPGSTARLLRPPAPAAYATRHTPTPAPAFACIPPLPLATREFALQPSRQTARFPLPIRALHPTPSDPPVSTPLPLLQQARRSAPCSAIHPRCLCPRPGSSQRSSCTRSLGCIQKPVKPKLVHSQRVHPFTAHSQPIHSPFTAS
jgi:hypothetical protein